MKRTLMGAGLVALCLLLGFGIQRFMGETGDGLIDSADSPPTEFETEAAADGQPRRAEGFAGSVEEAQLPARFPDESLQGIASEIRVFTEDGRPAAGVEVHIVGRRRLEALGLDIFEQFPPDLIADCPMVGRSDERGRLVYRRPKGDHALLAVQDDQIGRLGREALLNTRFSILGGSAFDSELRLRVASRDLFARMEDRLELRTEDRIDVLVKRSDGRTYGGAPVYLLRRGFWFNSGVDLLGAVLSARQDDGRLVVYLPRPREAHQEVEPLFILAGVFADEVNSHVTDAQRSGETLILTAPPFGSVEVRLVDGEGAPSREHAILHVAATSRSSPRSVRIEDGIGILTPAGLRCPLEIRVELDRQELSRPISRTVTGPSQDGEVVRVEINPSPFPVQLEGRLLDADGEALVHTQATARLGKELVVNRSDGQGRIAFGLDPTQHERDKLLPLVIQLQDDDQARDEVHRSIRLPRDGKVDLGDMYFPVFPILAAGRLVDEQGQPIAGVIPQARGYDPAENVRAVSVILDSRALNSEITDSQGRFAIRGKSDDPFLWINFANPGWSPAHVEARVGSMDLLVTATRLARLRGRILVPPDLNPQQIEVWTVKSEGKRSKVGALDEDGAFDLDLDAGSYDEVRIVLSAQVANSIELDALRVQTLAKNIVLVTGETTDLGEQGLTFPARFITIEFLGAEYLPAKGAKLRVWDQESGEPCLDRRIRERGEATFAVPRLPVYVAVDAPGVRIQRSLIVASPGTIVVRPCTKLIVEVQDFDGLRHDMDATLVITDEDGAGERTTSLRLDRSGRGEVLLPTIGPHALAVRVHRMFGTWNEDYVQIIPVQPMTLNVLDGRPEQRLHVVLPEGSIANAVATLRDN